MSRSSVLWALIVASSVLLGGRVWAQEAPPADSEPTAEPASDADPVPSTTEDKFQTSWLGLRLGGWWDPGFDGSIRVGDAGSGAGDLDVERDLSVATDTPRSDWIDFGENGAVELEAYFLTRWVSVFAWLVPPYRYTGVQTLGQPLTFGDAQFATGTRLDVELRQFFLGVDVEANLLNGRFFRVAPLFGVRAIGIDWRVRVREDSPRGEPGLEGTSAGTDLVSLGQFGVLPYPELGLHLQGGYRDIVEVGVKVAGGLVQHLDLDGHTLRVEGTLTVYPIPYLGLQLGARLLRFDLDADDESEAGLLELDIEMVGVTFAIVARFG